MKKDKSANIAKAAMGYMISNILIRSISLLTAPIFTRLLSPADYGIASNFNTWCTIVSCVTGLGLTTGIIRGKIEFKKDFNRFLSSVQTLGFIFSFTFFLLCLPLLNWLSDWMVLDKILIIIMFVYLIFSPSVSYAQINYRFEYKYKENIIISVVNSLGTVFCSIGLILMWTDKRYIGRCIGLIIPMTFMGIYFLVKNFRMGRCYINNTYWKYALSISLPMIPHALAMQILGQVDRIMIIFMCGETEAGIYSFGYSYAIVLSLLTNALNEAVQPTIYEWLESKKYSKVNRITSQISCGLILAVVLLTAFGPEILRILGTEEYYDGRWVIYPIVVGSFFQYMYQNYACVETYCKNTKIIAIGSVSAALINAILNVIFIPVFGYLAAGYTTMIGYLFLMIFHFVGARKVCKEKIFRGKDAVVLSVLAIILGLIFNLLYCVSIWIRYSITFLIIVLLVFLGRKKLKKIIVYMKSIVNLKG